MSNKRWFLINRTNAVNVMVVNGSLGLIVCFATAFSGVTALCSQDQLSSESGGLYVASPDDGQPPAPVDATDTGSVEPRGEVQDSVEGKEVMGAADSAVGIPAKMPEQSSESHALSRPVSGETPFADQKPVFGKDRPEWLGRPPVVEGEPHLVYVGSELCNTPEECYQSLEKSLVAEVSSYFDRFVLEEAGASSRIAIDGSKIRKEWTDTAGDYLATVNTESAGTQFQLWTIVKVPQEARDEVRLKYAETLVPDRLKQLAGGVLVALGAVAMINLGARWGVRRNQKKS